MSPKEGIRFLLYSSPSSPRMKLPSPPCNISYLGSEVGKKPIWTPQALIIMKVNLIHTLLMAVLRRICKTIKKFYRKWSHLSPLPVHLIKQSHFLWELNWKHITSDHITFKQISVQWYIISLTCWSISFCAWSSSPLISASSIACLVSCSLSKAY